MILTQDTRSTTTMTADSRTAVGTLTQDDRTSTTLTADNRTAVGTITQDSRVQLFLWSASNFPWQMALPWMWTNGGQIITQDTRS